MFSRFHAIAVVGLILVAVTAVVGADYYAQARSAVEQGESYDMARYGESISERITDASDTLARMKEQRELRKAGVMAMMPEAPEGWIKRPMTQADADLLMPRPELDEMSKQMIAEIRKSPTGAMMLKADDAARDQYVAEHVVYEHGPRLVALHIDFEERPRKAAGLTGVAQKMIIGQLAAMSSNSGFAMVQGVPYRRVRGFYVADIGGEADGPSESDGGTLREFNAGIGRQVRISVKSDASDAEVYQIIEAIDYDGLNGMLDEKLADVGSHVATLPLDVQRRLAQAAEDKRVAELQAEGEAASKDLMNLSGKLVTNRSALTKDGKAEGFADGAVSWFKSMTQGGEAEPEAEEVEKPEVKVRRLGGGGGIQMQGSAGAGSCTTVGGVKRCRIGSD